MDEITVLYDPHCRLCLRARYWLKDQPQFVPLRFVGAGTDRAREILPDLDPASTLRELTVVGSDGAVYRGAKAWLVCLWALRKYRSWAMTLGSPELLPAARRFINWVSRHRGKLA